MTLAPGSRVGSYEVIDLVGTGGMGEVYRAHDPRLGRHVAIKIIPASLATDADRVRRFEQEARAAAALSHPNILAVYDVGTHGDPTTGTDQAPYIVSELLEGQTLREQTHNGPLPVRKAVEAAIQIAQGLAAAHEKGIVQAAPSIPDQSIFRRQEDMRTGDAPCAGGRQSPYSAFKTSIGSTVAARLPGR